MVGIVVPFSSLGEDVRNLIERGAEVRERAYCPYSRFSVGAALVCADEGKVFTGCNVETGAYSSICAERTAIVKAVSEGYRSFSKLAVVALQTGQFVSPCGPCRQFVAEFGLTTEIYLCSPEKDNVLVTTAKELLPLSFQLKE